MLSLPAQFVDSALLKVENQDYDSWQTIYYQRFTVIATELVLAYALHKYVYQTTLGSETRLTHSLRYIQTSLPSLKQTSYAIALSVWLSPALLIIDHIHFQYNGFLYGILILSLVYARKQSTMLFSGLLFAGLLCLKHIYLYLAPAYFVYLLRAYCLSQKSILSIRFGNAIRLASGLGIIFGAAFGPFWYWGQLDPLLSRLFPFSRGLCHAYWAPNVWAMYSFCDRVLIWGMLRRFVPLGQC